MSKTPKADTASAAATPSADTSAQPVVDAPEAPAAVAPIPPKFLRAAVLVDVPRFGLKCGQVAEAPAAVIAAMKQAGEADGEPAAVEYALSQCGAATPIIEPDA